MPHITRHAEKRMRQRCGSSKSSVVRMASIALEKGITHSQTSGNLKRYVDALYLYDRKANNTRIWGDKVYLFRGNTLITVMQLPNKYRKMCNAIASKNRCEYAVNDTS